MMTQLSLTLSLRAIRNVVLALVLLLPAICHATEWNIDQLMHDLAQAHPDHASFIEKKSIAMLDKAVESSGELFYSAPDHLEKRTLKPKPESMVVTGNDLLIERGRKKYHLQLQDYPELAAFINSIRGTLAGDLKALERNYKLSLDGVSEGWTLQLLPLDAKMQAVLRHIRVAGLRDQVRSIEITQTDGDSSLMTIEKMEAQ